MFFFSGWGFVPLSDKEEFDWILLEEVRNSNADGGIGNFLAPTKPVGLGLAYLEFFREGVVTGDAIFFFDLFKNFDFLMIKKIEKCFNFKIFFDF